jgi:ABC-type multidrug transport system ATPase subunit
MGTADLPRVPLEVRFLDLNYEVDDVNAEPVPAPTNPNSGSTVQPRKRLLTNVSGVAHAGKLLSVMGPAGSGKTSLLDILSLRKRGGYLHGTLRYNDEAVETVMNVLPRFVAFVEEGMTFVAGVTVRDTIRFAGRLKLPESITSEVLSYMVEMVMVQVELLDIADRRVDMDADGTTAPFTTSEKRRLSIAIALMACPSLLVLESPTSGLGSSAESVRIVRILRRLSVQQPCTVICTVVEPCSSTFSHLDDLLLLADGQTAYCGPSSLVGEHFLDLGCACPSGMNLADFVCDVLSGGRSPSSKKMGRQSSSNMSDFMLDAKDSFSRTVRKISGSNSYTGSELYTLTDARNLEHERMKAERIKNEIRVARMIKRVVDGFKQSVYHERLHLARTTSGNAFLGQNAAPAGDHNITSVLNSNVQRVGHAYSYMQRTYVTSRWNEVACLTARHIQCCCLSRAWYNQPLLKLVVVAIFVGSMFAELDDCRVVDGYAMTDFMERNALFFSTTYLMIHAGMYIPQYNKQRAVYLRESASRMYRPSSHLVSTFLFANIVSAIEAACFSAIYFGLVDFQTRGFLTRELYFFFALQSYLVTLCGHAIAVAVAFASPFLEVSLLIYQGVVSNMVLFAGFYVPYLSMFEVWRVFYFLSPLKWAHTAVLLEFLECDDIGSEGGGGAPVESESSVPCDPTSNSVLDFSDVPSASWETAWVDLGVFAAYIAFFFLCQFYTLKKLQAGGDLQNKAQR